MPFETIKILVRKIKAFWRHRDLLRSHADLSFTASVTSIFPESWFAGSAFASAAAAFPRGWKNLLAAFPGHFLINFKFLIHVPMDIFFSVDDGGVEPPLHGLGSRPVKINRTTLRHRQKNCENRIDILFCWTLRSEERHFHRRSLPCRMLRRPPPRLPGRYRSGDIPNLPF